MRGKPLYMIGIVQDISHRRAVQEVLRNSEAVLQQRNIELERLVEEGVIDRKDMLVNEWNQELHFALILGILISEFHY